MSKRLREGSLYSYIDSRILRMDLLYKYNCCKYKMYITDFLPFRLSTPVLHCLVTICCATGPGEAKIVVTKTVENIRRGIKLEIC